MTKPYVMRLANRLLEELEYERDEVFVGRVTEAINFNQPFTEEEIAEMSEWEY